MTTELGSRNPIEQTANHPKKTPGRRTFLRTIGGALAFPLLIPALSACDRFSNSEPVPVNFTFRGPQYESWRTLAGKDLPRDITLAIANDLMNATEYPGFPEAGQLLRTSVVDFRSLTQFNPSLTEPLKITLEDLSNQSTTAELLTKVAGEGIEAQISARATNQSFTVTLADPREHTAQILLEETMAYGSHAVKALLISKEISHLAHVEELKQKVYTEFTSRFSLEAASLLPHADLIYENAVASIPLDTNPPMGFYYQNALQLLDWAGYWHITPALGRMIKQGVLTDQDKIVISANIDVLNLALKRGTLWENKPGVYVWKEGVGPFSPEWQDIMKNVKGVPRLNQ